jgi:hypothetical protein
MPKASGVLFDNVSVKGRRGGIVPNCSARADAVIERNAATAPAANIARFIAYTLVRSAYPGKFFRKGTTASTKACG